MEYSNLSKKITDMKVQSENTVCFLYCGSIIM